MPVIVQSPIVETPGKIVLKPVTLGEPGPHQVLIETSVCGICGSDLHIFKGRHPAAPLPAGVGHEFSGVVRQVGSAVTKVQAGQRVCVNPLLSCGRCLACRRGTPQRCEQMTFIHRAGGSGFAEFVLREEHWVYPLPESLSFEEGTMIETLSVALHAVNQAPLAAGSRAAIFGVGPVGLLVLQVARITGAGQVFAVDLQDHRLDMAKRLGADLAINARREDPVAAIREATDSLGVDVAYECVGHAEPLRNALSSLRRGGTAVAVGIYEEPQVTLDLMQMVGRELHLVGMVGYAYEFEEALRLAASGRVDLKPLISRVVPPAELQQAFDLLVSPEAREFKVLVKRQRPLER
jgi:2-desacetyl-2-hydroxyethyl bacteriochlorophyllide A dehydrogenase